MSLVVSLALFSSLYVAAEPYWAHAGRWRTTFQSVEVRWLGKNAKIHEAKQGEEVKAEKMSSLTETQPQP